MPNDITTIGISGIYAAEAFIAATESNITNASNPSYSSESVNLAAVPSSSSGGSAGVAVLGTARAQAPFLSSQINDTQSTLNYNQAFSQVATLAQQIVAPSSGTDLSQALQNMFNAFTNLSSSPQDSTLRTLAINAASDFAQVSATMSSNLQATANNELSSLAALVAQVNQTDSQIAKLNGEIVAAQSGGQGGAALMDQRDALVNTLAGLIGATADSSGNVTVGGVPLVSGGTALTLATTGAGPTLGLQVQLLNGNLRIQVNQVGGTMGGVLAGAQAVTNLQGEIDNFTTTIANALNAQHQAGFDLTGAAGTNLFQVPGVGGPISLNPAINVQTLAASGTAAGVPGDGSNATAMAALANNLGLDPAYPQSSPAQAIAQVESDFGVVAQSAANSQQQARASLQSLNALKQSITGVSLNDELVKLIQYQNLLQASERAVQAANNMTNFLIQELH
jgi:flagellar hook-associated protein 1